MKLTAIDLILIIHVVFAIVQWLSGKIIIGDELIMIVIVVVYFGLRIAIYDEQNKEEK